MKIKALVCLTCITLCTGLINAATIYSEYGTQDIAYQLQGLWSGPNDTTNLIIIDQLDQVAQSERGQTIILLNGSYQERAGDIETIFQQIVTTIATTIVGEIEGDYTVFIYRGSKETEKPSWQTKPVCILLDQALKPKKTEKILEKLREDYGDLPTGQKDVRMKRTTALGKWKNGKFNAVGFCISSKMPQDMVCGRIEAFLTCESCVEERCWIYADTILINCIVYPSILVPLTCTLEDTTSDTKDVVRTCETTIIMASAPSKSSFGSNAAVSNFTTRRYSGEEAHGILSRGHGLARERRIVRSNTPDLLDLYNQTSKSIPIEVNEVWVKEEVRRP